ncbi:hypothetical protein AALO_G00293710 [Alosa alosa]|uniref:Cadherin domain-containing protein n=1 Tax=Alosa alosa TaxID=278164 RepID=A0AAV6FHR9_9TELE|nr:hypothetical protein AALO_G00293710 [Alosa alosa]
MYLSILFFLCLWAQALTLKNLNYSVPEEQKQNTIIGNLAKDANIEINVTGQKSNFRVLENSARHLVDVDPTSGLLRTKQRIDRDTLCQRNPKCQLSMEVFANDAEIFMIKIEIQDINDNSPSFPNDVIDLEIAENAAPGTRFPLTAAHDLDSGENGLKTYQITRDDYSIFSLDVKSRGDGTKFPELVIQRPLDREERSHHTLILTAIDGGEYPRSGGHQRSGPPGTVIALVRVTDKDSGRNGQLQCRVLGNVPFKLEENYDNFFTVVTDKPLDRELQDEYNITILAKDNGNPPLNSTKSFTVKILDENDNAPHFTKPVYVMQISENNVPGEYMGSVLAIDPDLGMNGTVSYVLLPSNVSSDSIQTFVGVTASTGAIYALRAFNYEQTKYFDFKVLAKDSGSPHLQSNATVRVNILDVNDNVPVIVLPLLQNDTAEIHVPRNVGIGHIVTTVRAVDNDSGESGRLTYEITEGNEEHLFEIDPTTGEVRTAHPLWEEVAPVVELVIRVSDHGKPSLADNAKLIIKAYSGTLPEGEPRINAERHGWDMSLPLIVTLSIISIMLLAAMVTIVVKCKRENKEIRTYNCRIAEYSHPQLGKSKKKKINKNDIMLVQSEVEERDAMNVMNVVSSPSLATSPMYFDYQTRLPLSSPRSEVMYLKPAANNLPVPQGPVGCHTSFTGPVTSTTETPTNRMSIIQTDNFPAEPNYMGSRQQFVQSSSTFKDPERASLRDSGHGDSDQADSDQDTNKGSCCDMSAKEALKLKAAGPKTQLLEQATEEECVNCTEECRVLGHSDRCWMPQFPAGSQAEGSDYRTNVFVPAGMESVAVETETYETINPNGKKTFCTFGKERRDHTILVANVKPYLKAKRALSPLLQEVPSASCSPTKGCCVSTSSPLSSSSSSVTCKAPGDGAEGLPSTSHHHHHHQQLGPEGQYLSPSKHGREHQGASTDPVAKVLAEARSRISQEVGMEEGMAGVVSVGVGGERGGRDGMDADQVVRDIDKLLQDCRTNESTPVRK